MFDIGISEIAVIAVVALVVIGPERLPKVARTVGTLLGRAQRYVNDVKAEVNREMELEELRKLQTEMKDAARGIHEQVSSAGAEMQSAVHDMEKQLNEGVTSIGTPDTAPAATSTAVSGTASLAGPAAAVPPTDSSGNAAVVDSADALVAAPDSTAPNPVQPAAAEAFPSGIMGPADPAPIENPAQSSLFPEQTIR